MNNITLITSVIDTPNTPLSYINTRSIYTKEERFIQTKNTIKTMKENIPNNKIFVVECSLLSNEESNYFKENTDYFINLYYVNDVINRIYSISKSMGEGTMTIYALKYLFDNKIVFDNLFKISGRYWLNHFFNYNTFNNNSNVIHYINHDSNNCLTALYKINYDTTKKWYEYLLISENKFKNCIGYELIFADFMKTVNDHEKKIVNTAYGVSGYISVDGSLLNV
jgi:hypothetical protein